MKMAKRSKKQTGIKPGAEGRITQWTKAEGSESEIKPLGFPVCCSLPIEGTFFKGKRVKKSFKKWDFVWSQKP